MVDDNAIAINHFMNVASFGALEKINCALCNRDKTRLVTVQKWFGVEFHVVRCVYCNLIFTNPRPTEEWKEKLYDAQYNPVMKRDRRKFLYLPPPHRNYMHKRLIEFLINKVGSEKTLLDGGCAGGQFVKLACENGFNASGFEFSSEAIAYAREQFNLTLIRADAANIPVPDNSYDIITLLQVFEHFRDPIGTLKELKRILKPRGILLIETVNYLKLYLLETYFPFLKSLYLRTVRKDLSSFWAGTLPWFPFDHYYHWTPKTLLTVLRKADFEQCQTHFISNYLSGSQQMDPLRLLHLRKRYNDMIRFFLRISDDRLNLWGALIATAEKS